MASNGAPRYVLVEAEPDTGRKPKFTPTPADQLPPGGPGSGSGSKSGEGRIGDARSGDGRSDRPRGKNKSGSGRRGGGRGGGARPERRHGERRGSSYYGMTPAEAKKMAAEYAVKQMEWYFSVHNLCSDVFMRSYMDTEGYIPVAFVANFPGCASLGAEFTDILEALKSSEMLEFDEANETMRLREGWDMWILPNASGGLGVPRYIKLSEDEAAKIAAQQEAQAAAKSEEPSAEATMNGAAAVEEDASPAAPTAATEGGEEVAAAEAPVETAPLDVPAKGSSKEGATEGSSTVEPSASEASADANAPAADLTDEQIAELEAVVLQDDEDDLPEDDETGVTDVTADAATAADQPAPAEAAAAGASSA